MSAFNNAVFNFLFTFRLHFNYEILKKLFPTILSSLEFFLLLLLEDEIGPLLSLSKFLSSNVRTDLPFVEYERYKKKTKSKGCQANGV